MISQDGCPRLTDFSFAELAATDRQRAIDVSELLTWLAGRIGPDRAVATAAAVISAGGVAAAVPLMQPLALSAGTRRAIKGRDGLLKNTRAAAIAASGDDADKTSSGCSGCGRARCWRSPRWPAPFTSCCRRSPM